MIYFFDDYELDTERYALRHSSVPVHIEPKVFDVLVYLIQHRGQVVTKEHLHTHLWADQFVSDSALTYCIASARKAVGDTGRVQRMIKTVHRRGYSFIAQVHAEEESLEEAPEAFDGAAETTPLSSSALSAAPVPLVAERHQLTAMWCSLAVASELALQLDPAEQHEVILRAQTLFGEVIRRFEGYLA
jgi:DNA-binding winged helix-turn-helix (wHTH) protein